MDEILRELGEQIEKTRRRLYQAKTKTGLIMVSRRMDALINLYTRLSTSPPELLDKGALLPGAAAREPVRRTARLAGTAPYRPLLRPRPKTARGWRRGDGLQEKDASPYHAATSAAVFVKLLWARRRSYARLRFGI